MIRCLIVDDSATARLNLREILSKSPNVTVIDEANDGESAVQKVLNLRPDVVTMDIKMPGLDGFEAIEEIMVRIPTAIIVVCSGVNDEALGIALKALQLGAVEVLAKPRASDPKNYEAQCEAIRVAVQTVQGIKVIARRAAKNRPAVPFNLSLTDSVSCIGIAGSTGAPAQLRTILASLPKGYPVPILIVQHIVESFCHALAKWLADSCQLPVRIAVDGEPILPGQVLMAPGDRHMMVSMGRVRLDDGPPVKSIKPSANVLFASMAREYRKKSAGFVMSGMGEDGTSGLHLMRKVGAYTAAQGPSTSLLYGMPRVALETGAAGVSLEVDDFISVLLQMGGSGSPSPSVNAVVPAAGPKRRLLLVDDTETILKIEQAALGESYELFLARDGQEALDAIRQYRPDGVVMDIKMPRMCGNDALREIRKNPQWRALPIVMCTSETDPALLEECTQNGCQAIVSKPINVEQLRGIVRKFIPP